MTEIADDELLYRRIVPASGINYSREPDGNLKIRQSAFNSSVHRISVDRAKLCSHDPSYTQRDTNNGVVSLTAHIVRAIQITSTTHGIHTADVEAAPLDDNPAHAEIYARPELGRSAFDRLKESLARCAQWVIFPMDVRP